MLNLLWVLNADAICLNSGSSEWMRMFMKILVVLMLLSGVATADESPWDDKKITCEEMEAFPELVFSSGADLGTGHGSPNEVDYGCPKSLSQQSFLKTILSMAGSIRQPSKWGLPHCTGSMAYARWRYFQFDLSQLGYYTHEWQEMPEQKKIREAREGKRERYFEEWSYYSRHNRALYLAYQAELKRIRPQLVQWYLDNHPVNAETAERYADRALSSISEYGFGRYRHDWQPEAQVDYTAEAIQGQYDRFLAGLDLASDAQKLNSLRRLLFHSPSISVVATLANSISPSAKNDRTRSESPLSIVINSPDYLKTLLQAGFAPDHQNVFGKTSLYYAVEFGELESARVLLVGGADANHAYQLEKYAIYRAPSYCVGIKKWQRTPLMHAAQHADIKMIKLLLEYGADPMLEDVQGSTAVDYARENGKPENEAYLMAEIKGLSQQR
ncbi:ankyrin repeat domain-containing protein [Alcanivorax sp. S6407]|uniref:ankyrin repeat domain-containing protein n=1 Tax=Alcanivorax sp. S6407 TaxID=2926424 RepID=UPI001FF1E6EF|nr:ankyrin repeat domain-containing protein [Alcanivorax sp. S6407]MCK0154165.1 ankyrin repeat domain-containing protein [Alcanivorax sp. S6407]